jgi:hypothetical protein
MGILVHQQNIKTPLPKANPHHTRNSWSYMLGDVPKMFCLFTEKCFAHVATKKYCTCACFRKKTAKNYPFSHLGRFWLAFCSKKAQKIAWFDEEDAFYRKTEVTSCVKLLNPDPFGSPGPRPRPWALGCGLRAAGSRPTDPPPDHPQEA